MLPSYVHPRIINKKLMLLTISIILFSIPALIFFVFALSQGNLRNLALAMDNLHRDPKTKTAEWIFRIGVLCLILSGVFGISSLIMNEGRVPIQLPKTGEINVLNLKN